MPNANDAAAAGAGLPDGDDAISRALVHARRSATPVTVFPGAVPESMAEAYAIQSASIQRWPDTVGGWKVGALPPALHERYATDRLAGPIYRSQIHAVALDSSTVMSIYVGGFAAVEAEFIFRLGQAIPPLVRDWSNEDLIAVVADLHVGAEIASSPIADINDFGPTVVVSDFGNNAGLLVGPAIDNWHLARPEDLPSRVIVDGATVGEASAAALPGGPLAALRFLVTLCATRGLELPADTLISTGATTGIHDVTTSSVSRVEFGDYGGFEVTYEPMSGGN